MSKMKLKIIGILILAFGFISAFLWLKAQGIHDPGYEDLKDPQRLQKWHNENRIKKLEKQRIFCGIMGIVLGIGGTFLLLGLIKKETHNKTNPQDSVPPPEI